MKFAIAVCVAVIVALTALSAVLLNQVGQLQTRLNAPHAAVIPAIVGHYGLCVATTLDANTGDLSYVSVTTPRDTAGVISCPDGTFVSVAPGQ
jgi:hypothetical protein